MELWRGTNGHGGILNDTERSVEGYRRVQSDTEKGVKGCRVVHRGMWRVQRNMERDEQGHRSA